MKKITSLAFVVLLLFSSCVSEKNYNKSKNSSKIYGEGPEITQLLSIESFTSIDLAGAADVVIQQGDLQEVKVKGQSNIIDKIKKNVVNGMWTITLESGSYNYKNLTFYITVPSIKEVELSGSGDITINDFNSLNQLGLFIKGAGDIDFHNLNECKKLEVSIKGSGDVSSKSSSTSIEQLFVDIDGAGDFKALNTQTDDCTISIAGTGDCAVHVKNKLKVHISGVGDIKYKGQPTIEKKITGVGELIKN